MPDNPTEEELLLKAERSIKSARLLVSDGDMDNELRS
jgi:hypothetical protein